jgi:N-acyl homoserine lactone hydrolase
VLRLVVVHPQGLVLFDTGIGTDPEIDQHYRPSRVALPNALRQAGAHIDEVTVVANCHLHFDHCGGNPELSGRPIYTQRVELATARTDRTYTLPSLIDPDDVNYEVISGTTEILPGLFLMPTPGHTDGHQSLIVRQPSGTVVVAGQLQISVAAYESDLSAWEAVQSGALEPSGSASIWMDALQRFDPKCVMFAHDDKTWTK